MKLLSSDSLLTDVRTKLASLKKERTEFKKEVEELEQLISKDVSRSTDKLNQRIDDMLTSIETQMQKYDTEIGNKLNILRVDQEGRLSISDLEDALMLIRDHPNDERIKKIVKQLDKDGDGLVALSEIIILAEMADHRDSPK